MNLFSKRLAAATAIAALMTPALGHAGTRAGKTTVVVPASVAKTVGPKGGFPSAPGLEIAKIKANDNAAFKRKSAGT
ncbi:hypothetical protein [Novosphingobium jiangmenense]|uniref:Uncharacterized protein n=1 Tax=Novosphingobium jiangmenense TaxID=2791981 RepID=A0ABS0HHD6_9SPHN|nr:hypothetical protein [Novosphingobium jiangmenense]MBF9151573.1 hypothetical protein [Novosphingobium jiangmenense]